MCVYLCVYAHRFPPPHTQPTTLESLERPCFVIIISYMSAEHFRLVHRYLSTGEWGGLCFMEGYGMTTWGGGEGRVLTVIIRGEGKGNMWSHYRVGQVCCYVRVCVWCCLSACLSVCVFLPSVVIPTEVLEKDQLRVSKAKCNRAELTHFEGHLSHIVVIINWSDLKTSKQNYRVIVIIETIIRQGDITIRVIVSKIYYSNHDTHEVITTRLSFYQERPFIRTKQRHQHTVRPSTPRKHNKPDSTFEFH